MENIKLSNKCEAYITETTDEDCTVSITPTSKIKIEVGEDFYIFDTDGKIGYVKFRGWYPEVNKLIGKMKRCIKDHKQAFSDLILNKSK